MEVCLVSDVCMHLPGMHTSAPTVIMYARVCVSVRVCVRFLSYSIDRVHSSAFPLQLWEERGSDREKG